MADHVLGDIAQIPRGEGRNFKIGGITVAVFRTHADEVFATQAKCPHKSGPLADGLLGGASLLCPLHELGFDLRTGAGLGHAACLTVYPARLDPAGVLRVTI
jgi:nitrite reductase (NADH) small subunit